MKHGWFASDKTTVDYKVTKRLCEVSYTVPWTSERQKELHTKTPTRRIKQLVENERATDIQVVWFAGKRVIR